MDKPDTGILTFLAVIVIVAAALRYCEAIQPQPPQQLQTQQQ